MNIGEDVAFNEEALAWISCFFANFFSAVEKREISYKAYLE